jgi:hypothetical protein
MEYVCDRFLNFVSLFCDYFSAMIDALRRSLADMQRGIFKFGVFNAVQSTCFDMVGPAYRLLRSKVTILGQVLHSDENLVLSSWFFLLFMT